LYIKNVIATIKERVNLDRHLPPETFSLFGDLFEDADLNISFDDMADAESLMRDAKSPQSP